MKVRTGTKLQGSSRFIEVEVEDSDLGPSDQNLSAGDKFKRLNQTADILIVQYLLQHGEITQDYAAQRLQEITRGSQV